MDLDATVFRPTLESRVRCQRLTATRAVPATLAVVRTPIRSTTVIGISLPVSVLHVLSGPRVLPRTPTSGTRQRILPRVLPFLGLLRGVPTGMAANADFNRMPPEEG